MEEYTFEFSMPFIKVDNFKYKPVTILMNLIAGSRLIHYIRFSSYANISFNDWDTKHQYPTVKAIPDYNRSKTNCIVYDIIDTRYNNLYNKIFIYNTINKEHVTYGYIFYNTETGAILQRNFLEYLDDELVIGITRTFNSFDRIDLLKYYSDKSDMIQELHKPGYLKEKALKQENNKQERIERYKNLGLNIKVA